jgi:hypothetical protein
MAGCFNPGDVDDTDVTVGTTDPTSEPPSSSTDAPTTHAPTTGLDSTSQGVVDEPPTVELRVDGATMPAPVVHARRVSLTAEASDDGTVTRVEFYDGDVLLATDDTAPFATELLLTSVDAGAHAFVARAIDDAAQVGESAVVELTVSIEGGATVASQTNLFEMGGIAFHPGIGVVHDADENVIVVGSLTSANFNVTGLGVVSLSPDLASTNWQVTVPMSLVAGQPQFLTLGRPVIDADGSTVGIGGNAMGTDGVLDPNVAIFRVATDGSGPLPFLELPSNPDAQNIAVAGLALDPSGNGVLAGPDDFITKLDPASGGALWQTPVGQTWTVNGLGGHRIGTDHEGDVIFDVFTCDGGAGTCALETRKINGFDGNQLWSREIVLGNDQYFMHVGGSVAGPQGQVLTLHGPPLADGGGLHMVLRDGGGSTRQDLVIAGEGDEYAVADVAYDPQGFVVAVGTVLPGGDVSMRQPFAIRFDEAGTVLWQRTFGFGRNDDQAMGLAIDTQGRLLVVGIADIEAIFIVFLGDVWVAQLDL